VLVASLPPDSDPAALVQRGGVDAARRLVGGALALARYRVMHSVDRADLGSAEGKDRLIRDLHEVFADIPPSAVREDLIALVAERVGIRPELVGSWLPGPDRISDPPSTGLANGRPSEVVADGSAHRLLVRCVADPAVAMALPAGPDLARLFPDGLARRAAEHIRTHATNPAAALPADDHELVSFITSLLAAPAGA
jgi:DNA primase